MEFVSLGSIIYDLLNIIRGAQIADDEPITEKQIEAWVHQYRALFIKRDIDKGKMINPSYIQSIDSIPLTLDTTRNLYHTTIIPSTIDFNYKSGLLYVGDIDGNAVQIIPETRSVFQKYNKYSNDDTVAFLKDNKLYLNNSKGLQSISIRGVFQVPFDISTLNSVSYTYDSYYPIPISILPSLKKEILMNELGIEYNAPNDNTNDSNNNLSSDLEGYKQIYRTNKSV
jgi:hypothetical protein